jgi:hypothetical protein
MQDQDQSRIDLTSDVKKANKALFPIMLLLIAFIYFLYNNINNSNLYNDLRSAVGSYDNTFLFLLIYLLCLVFLIIFHAYLHAFFVAPTLANIPKCLLRSDMEMAKAL